MKICEWRSVLVFLVFLCGAWGEPATLWAETNFNTGCFIEYSPFYQKLLNAGVFDVPVAQPTQQPQSMQLLFIKAHLFHYAGNKSRREQWQSAEETTRLFSGNCADKAIWLYRHLRQNGYQNVSLAIGRYSPSSKVLHMWVNYEEPSGKTLLLDPTIQRKPWKITDFSKSFYKPLYLLSGQDCVSF